MRLLVVLLTLGALASSASAQRSEDPMAAPPFDEASQRDVPPATDRSPSPELVDGVSAWLGLGVHGSLLSDRLDRSNLNVRIGYAAAAGARWGRLGVFGVVEHNLWMQTEFDLRVGRGVLNVGVGGEYFYAHQRVRLSLALGLSVLLEDRALDPAPSFGVFGEVRPTGLRWSRGTSWTVQLDPIGLAIVAPVLHRPRLFEIQYRMTLTLEWQSVGGRKAFE